MTCVYLAATFQVVYSQVSFAQAPPLRPAVPSPAPGAAAPYDGSPPQLPQPPNSAPPIAAPVVTLRADNPRAVLQRFQLRWQDICVTPCGVPVDPAGTYRIAGDTIRPSTEFRMRLPSGPVLIDTQTGSALKHSGGLVLAIGGGVSALVGIVYRVEASNTLPSVDQARKVEMNAIGLFYLLIGGVLMAVGIPLSMSSTEVSVFNGREPPTGRRETETGPVPRLPGDWR
jgi:hypothetical protein